MRRHVATHDSWRMESLQPVIDRTYESRIVKAMTTTTMVTKHRTAVATIHRRRRHRAHPQTTGAARRRLTHAHDGAGFAGRAANYAEGDVSLTQQQGIVVVLSAIGWAAITWTAADMVCAAVPGCTTREACGHGRMVVSEPRCLSAMAWASRRRLSKTQASACAVWGGDRLVNSGAAGASMDERAARRRRTLGTTSGTCSDRGTHTHGPMRAHMCCYRRAQPMHAQRLQRRACRARGRIRKFEVGPAFMHTRLMRSRIKMDVFREYRKFVWHDGCGTV